MWGGLVPTSRKNGEKCGTPIFRQKPAGKGEECGVDWFPTSRKNGEKRGTPREVGHPDFFGKSPQARARNPYANGERLSHCGSPHLAS
jgi:hypothetical protein